MRSFLAWIAAGSGAFLALGACNALTGIGNLTEEDCVNGTCDGGGVDARAPDGAPLHDASLPEASADAGKDAGPGKPACPVGLGPSMVLAGSFCIDSTEVTEADYAAFLAADAGRALEPSNLCAFNTDYAPKAGCSFDPTGHAGLPVACLDWCDAYAYCAWAGKRLCGTVGDGGGVDYEADFRKPGAEWFAACSHDGTLAYPYGPAYDASACNGADNHGGAAVATGSIPTCVGGYPGVFDMSGNVYEWIDSCETGVPCTDGGGCCGTCCRRMGGAADSVPVHLSCASDLLATGQGIGAANPVTGLRCCASRLP